MKTKPDKVIIHIFDKMTILRKLKYEWEGTLYDTYGVRKSQRMIEYSINIHEGFGE
jgi:hypothetical protein